MHIRAIRGSFRRRVWHPCHTHATLCQSSHRIHRIHGSFWQRIFSHRFHRCSQIFRLRIFSHGFHRCSQIFLLCQKLLWVLWFLWENSLVGSPNLCVSVQSVGVFVGGYGIPAIPTPPSAIPPTEFTEFTEASGRGFSPTDFTDAHRNFWRKRASHGIHGIHRNFWCRRASHGFHRCPQMVRLRKVLWLLWKDSLVAAWVWQGCHTLLICAHL